DSPAPPPTPAPPPPPRAHPPPPVDAPPANLILDNAPCAYKLTDAQYNGARTDGPGGVGTTVAQRIAAHGWKVITTTDGYYVPLNQPERGLIPLLLDPLGVEKLTDGERVYPTLTGRRNGPLVVTGFTCAANATVNGPVTVRAGAALVTTGTTISGPITANGAAGVLLADSTVNGPVQITNTTDAVSIIDVTVAGPVNLTGNTTGTDIPLLAGSTIRGPLTCTGNNPTPTNLGVANTLHGPRITQCAAL
ncbi:carboxypeptidase, partial [Micromonospora sp. NPDC049114]